MVRAAAELNRPPAPLDVVVVLPADPPAVPPLGERDVLLAGLAAPSGGGGGSENGLSRTERTERRPLGPRGGFSPLRGPSSVRTLRLEALLRLAARLRFSTSLNRI